MLALKVSARCQGKVPTDTARKEGGHPSRRRKKGEPLASSGLTETSIKKRVKKGVSHTSKGGGECEMIHGLMTGLEVFISLRGEK